MWFATQVARAAGIVTVNTASGSTRNQVVLHQQSTLQWLRFQDPYQVLEAATIDDVIPALRYIERQVREKRRFAAGFISYEASSAFDPALCTKPAGNFPLLWFGLYGAPEVIALPEPNFESYALGEIAPSVSREEYSGAIAGIKRKIHTGDTYQVNYTLQLRIPFKGDPWHLFLAMVRAQSPGYAAWVDTGRFAVCSASPELFFKLDGNSLTCKPMKGTVKRGCTLAEDESLALWLRQSEKNRAENLMIVDMVRNDLGRIADAGSVDVLGLFEVERHPTLWQMTSTIRATTHQPFTEILAALFPCASITGAPKVRTTHIIADLEKTRRSLYTGCIGYLGPGPNAQFSVAIRTAVVDRVESAAEYGTGGGIVWDSSSEDEYTEAVLKSRILSEQRPGFSLLETLLWTPDEGYFLLEYHMKRLADSAAYFGYTADIVQIQNSLLKKAARFGQDSCRVRLLVDEDGTSHIQFERIDPAVSEGEVRIRLAAGPVSSKNIFLYHKTSWREVYDEAKRNTSDCDDVVLWNERHELTESCIANIVVDIEGVLYTPPVASGLLAGVFRAWLLDQGKIRERVLKASDLKACRKTYLINSVRKWREAVWVE
jgi:para-aminobenzoate synthetase/4-amino-4-deoxychorismate lyase